MNFKFDSVIRGWKNASKYLAYLYLTRRFAESHIHVIRLPREGYVPGSTQDLFNRYGSRSDSDRESARAQSTPWSSDLRVSGLFVRWLRRDAEKVSGAASQDAIRRGVLLLDHYVDSSESWRWRSGGVSTKSLRSGGNDRHWAAALEMLQKRVEKTTKSEIGGLSAVEGTQVHRRSDAAYRGHFDEAVRFSKSHHHRGQRLGTHAFDLRKKIAIVKINSL